MQSIFKSLCDLLMKTLGLNIEHLQAFLFDGISVMVTMSQLRKFFKFYPKQFENYQKVWEGYEIIR